MKPKVSVVLPVYNVEKYILKCIKSILDQTLKDIEIIIVNDGSTDRSGNMAIEMSRVDDRIIIINQKNKGLSEARNAGMNVASGEYIAFIDSDDWLDNESLEKMYTYAKTNNCDVVQCNYKIIKDNIIKNINNKIPMYKILTKEEIDYFLKSPIIEGKLSTYAWNKIYKLDFLKENNIYFEKIPRFEDWYFNLKTITKMNKFLAIEDNFYNYREIEGSLSRKYYYNYEDLVIELQEKKYEYMKIWNMTSKQYNQKHILSLVNDMLKLINYISDEKYNLSKDLQINKIKKIIESDIIQSNFNDEEHKICINSININKFYLKIILYGVRKKYSILIYNCIKSYKLYNKIKSKIVKIM